MAATQPLPLRFQSITIRELRLFWRALRLGLTAQRITHGVPLEEVIETLLAKSRIPAGVDSQEAATAAARAGRRLEFLGRLNSCLIRTLIAGTLLSDRDDLTLRIGVQKDVERRDKVGGHAWLTLGTQILPHPDEALTPDGEPYLVMASFPMRRSQ
jgi:hypothetical protein